MCKAYADDLTIITGRVKNNQIILNRIGAWLSWTRTMKAKPTKCKTLATSKIAKEKRLIMEPHTKNVYTTFDPQLLIDSQPIPALGPTTMELDDRFKFLGRVLAHDLKEKLQELLVTEAFNARMSLIDRDLVNGLMKVWIYQFYVVPTLAWPFQVYDFPLDFAKQLDRTAICFLKKWTGIFKRADNGVLFRDRDRLGLGLTSPSSLLMQMQVLKCHIIKHSKEGPDGPLRKLYLRRLEKENKIVRRWKPCPTLEEAEAKLEFDLKFAGQRDKAGLGTGRYNQKLSVKAKRKRIIANLKAEQEHKMELHSMSLALQGNWTKWKDDIHPANLKWKDLINIRNPKIIAHRLNSFINCLPTPSNLAAWGYVSSPLCPLCKEAKGTQMHIFSSCRVALEQKRYSWRHDSVLANIELYIQNHLSKHNDQKAIVPPRIFIPFVKAREKIPHIKPPRRNLLSDAVDWCCQVDYCGNEKIFPPEICSSNLRPDIVLWSSSSKCVILIELTCPSEENIPQAKSRKTERYVDLINQIKDAGWSPTLFTIEAGVRGCLSKSFAYTLRRLGMSNAVIRKASNTISQTVSRCSYAIFLARKHFHWSSPRLLVGHDYPSP